MSDLSLSPKVSILVPCFNVESYVVQCLESIKEQTLKEIEIICLNDGSTDSTLEKIYSVADNDPRFRIVNKANSGYGATMNLGLSMARGSYIGIVESDDFIETDMFERLFNEASQHDLDIARCCFERLTDNGGRIDSCRYLPKSISFNCQETPDALRHPPSIWAAIYRREWLEKADIRFRETPGASFQDVSFAFKTALSAERQRTLPDVLHHYRIHDKSSVKTSKYSYNVIEELDECLRFARSLKAQDVISTVMLSIEYATFKWNYLRLTPEEAHLFYERWVTRWQRNHGYGIVWNGRDKKLFFYYWVLTHFPSLFERYLISKVRQ